MQIVEGQPFFIYALVSPITLEVKYVGQTIDLDQRTRSKTHMGTKHNAPLTQWLRTLGYLKPYRVILEQGINRRVVVSATAVDRAHIRGRRPMGVKDTWLSFCLEAKWIKRFRRTILNKNKTGEIGAYQALVNPPLPWGNTGDAPTEIPPRAYKSGYKQKTHATGPRGKYQRKDRKKLDGWNSPAGPERRSERGLVRF